MQRNIQRKYSKKERQKNERKKNNNHRRARRFFGMLAQPSRLFHMIILCGFGLSLTPCRQTKRALNDYPTLPDSSGHVCSTACACFGATAELWNNVFPRRSFLRGFLAKDASETSVAPPSPDSGKRYWAIFFAIIANWRSAGENITGLCFGRVVAISRSHLVAFLPGGPYSSTL